MANAQDYLKWRGDLSFEASPVNEVDLFLCSQLSTPDYAGLVGEDPVELSKAAGEYFETHSEDAANLGVLQSTGVLPMVRLLPECPRFAQTRISRYVNIVNPDREEQFAALTIILPDGTTVVSFRGTDDTIIGWKEDFNIAILDSTPAQQDAVDYLAASAAGTQGPVYVCGHSKGGNLAVYAAAKVPAAVQERIRAVFSFDGPGFRSSFLLTDGFHAIEDRVFTVLSQHSTVGVLLNMAGTSVIVRSNTSGPMAHDGFNWEVLGTRFVREPELSSASRLFEETSDETIFSMSDEEMREFTDQLFDALLSTGARTITDFTRLNPVTKLELLKKLHSDKNVGSFTTEYLEQLIGALHPDEPLLKAARHRLSSSAIADKMRRQEEWLRSRRKTEKEKPEAAETEQ